MLVSQCLFSDILIGSLRHPRRLNYTWINTDRKHVQLPAPTYIDYVMTWVQNLLDDENTFPTKSGKLAVLSLTLKHINY